MNLGFWIPILVVLALQAVVCTFTWRHARDTMKRRRIASSVYQADVLSALRNVETGLKENAAIVTSRHPEPHRHVYEMARRMAAEGASAEGIAMACHIPAHEIRLLECVHARTGRSGR